MYISELNSQVDKYIKIILGEDEGEFTIESLRKLIVAAYDKDIKYYIEETCQLYDNSTDSIKKFLVLRNRTIYLKVLLETKLLEEMSLSRLAILNLKKLTPNSLYRNIDMEGDVELTLSKIGLDNAEK